MRARELSRGRTAGAQGRECARRSALRMPVQQSSTVVDAGWRATAVSPLLLELTRALRARRLYPSANPALDEILGQAGAIWASALARSPVLRLSVHADGFSIASGERVMGPSLAELASELA